MENGIDIASQPRMNNDTIEFHVRINAGSIDEIKPGIAHFLEHILIQNMEELERRGGRIEDLCTTGRYIDFSGELPNT
ncbi:MAG: insulinase family protein, partial [Saprospiraceae bacterium]|nr:insulinase family protein [Saprospiraceae bacterium]